MSNSQYNISSFIKNIYIILYLRTKYYIFIDKKDIKSFME
ncbi:hypothetical protein HMPREF0220_1299 [Clostridioides difficile NAP08]|uniref:Uncharacterized protein n=1 Tax=Clostridioides difficile NAP08 TaxID=525259 RepID=D5Q317_CLODI|nr:hypothetical protein HMPREF0220_1299 [Clostridioides difficile NAP08]EFH16123.1 hypothetical protein HMPREF0219_1233 [Clostridioides difficile NAP07]